MIGTSYKGLNEIGIKNKCLKQMIRFFVKAVLSNVRLGTRLSKMEA